MIYAVEENTDIKPSAITSELKYVKTDDNSSIVILTMASISGSLIILFKLKENKKRREMN